MLDAAGGTRASVLSRLGAALIDAGAVILVAACSAQVAAMDWPAATAIVALVYFFLATALFGKVPRSGSVQTLVILEPLTQGPTAIAAAWRVEPTRFSHLFGSADGSTPDRWMAGGAHVDHRRTTPRTRDVAPLRVRNQGVARKHSARGPFG